MTVRQPDQPLPFERRCVPRTPADGSVMAAFTDEETGELTLTRLDLIDSSGCGLGLRSPLKITPGHRFSLYGIGRRPLPYRTGIVAGCRSEGEQYRIGLRCDSRIAA